MTAKDVKEITIISVLERPGKTVRGLQINNQGQINHPLGDKVDLDNKKILFDLILRRLMGAAIISRTV